MRAVIVSDIHGSSYYANRLRTIILKENPDMFIVLGDLYYHRPRNDLSEDHNPMEVANVLNGFKNIIYVVKGNCDSEIDEMISINNRKIEKYKELYESKCKDYFNIV